MGTATGILLFGFGLIPVLFVKESNPHVTEVLSHRADDAKKKKAGFIKNLKESLTCKPFLIVSMSVTLVLMASAIVGSLHYYINIYYIYAGDKAAASTAIGWYWTSVYLVAALIVPLVSRLAIRFGKKAVFQGALFWGVGLMALRWFLYTPNHPYLQLVDGLLYAFLDASVFLLCLSMMADVCDFDEVNHGLRREGVFAAVYGWMFKTGLALGALVAGVLLAKIGFDKKVVAVPSADTLTGMRMFFSAVPGIAFLISGLLCCLYPLSKKRMTEIRLQLEGRD